MPLNHPWELQTWYNMFVDLARDHSPYATFHDLSASYLAQQGLNMPRESLSRGMQETFYAYYAYPPLLMMLYYPVAKLANLVMPLYYQFTIHGPAAKVIVPPIFNVFFKLPIFMAEMGIILLLWRMTGEAAARRFFLNPLVILVSATWTVEALMVFPALLSLYLVRRQRYLGERDRPGRRGVDQVSPGGVVAGRAAALVASGREPTDDRRVRGDVLRDLRRGGGAVLDRLPRGGALPGRAARGQPQRPPVALPAQPSSARLDMNFLAYAVSPLVGHITQTAGLVLVYAYLARRPHRLAQAFIIALVAFFLGSKVVNEQYLYLLVPLLALELAEWPSEAKETVLKLMYALPLTFAFINIPIVYIAAPFFRYFWRGSFPVTYAWARIFPLEEHAIFLSILALAFVAASIYALRVITREGMHDQVPAEAH